MPGLGTGRRDELQERRAHLLRLHWELTRLGVRVSVRKPRNGRWKLKLRGPVGWSETVLCAGAEGTYVYVTVHGRLLGRAQDARHVARVLLWMLERRRR
ncbi:hypothetical protein [Thermomonospora cellulosilytica]|uniref:Uncharacterized protein n=1 Tax=Thermomonospora cellulosilytica TaxID=1411118 RepID=A0A7W3MVU5_9ACTN|nr:hypothetical protein [Thermomonospora cellulosilytica]MBA9002844.1 hypothetical protein [Thermomonospora cellulosilytica]